MALNSGAINSRAINGSAAPASSTGTGVINIVQKVNGAGLGLINVAQLVASKSTVGADVTIQQVVEFQQTGTGTITIDQNVVSRATKVVSVEQTVVAVSEPTTYFGRNGYEPRIYLANNLIDLDKLHGKVICTFTEDDAPQLEFTIIPDTGSQDIRQYRGQVVVYKVRDSSGITSVYSGKVNTPDVMIIDQKIKFKCSLDLDQVVNNTVDRSALNKIGYYNNKVFSEASTTLQELRDRVSTVPQTIVVDRVGNVDVVDIAPKATADHTLTNSDIRRKSVTFQYSSGQRYINKVNLKISYTYNRLHHQEITHSTLAPYTTVCELLIGGYTILTRQLVYSAVDGSDWPVKGGINFTPIYDSGFYNCGDASGGFSTISCTGNTSVVKDSNGDPIQIDGKDQLEYDAQACTNIADTLCIGASWIATKRYAQNITVEYTLSVASTQSQDLVGLKEKDDNFSLTDEYNVEEWENYEAYTTKTPSEFIKNTSAPGGFWLEATQDKGVLNTSTSILLNRAKSDILKSHRDDRVMFTTDLMPSISLKDTIALDADRVTAKGKVYSYSHIIDISGGGEAYTDVTLALSVSAGTATDSALTLPTLPTSDPVYPTSNVVFSGKYGEPPEHPQAGSWKGHIANKLIQTYTGGVLDLRMTQYPVKFVYDSPSISDDLRDTKVLAASKNYEVSIPNDTLTVNFTDNNYE